MIKKFLILGALVLVAVFGIVSMVSAKGGFDQFGYNETARVFNGTGMSWCMGKVGDQAWCDSYLGEYSGDKLVMKWNAAWDACNDTVDNDDPAVCAGAWTDNEWNGMAPGGSGSVWHYKYIWVGSEGEDSPYWQPGGYLIWDNYEVIMDQGHDPNFGPGHIWFAHATPNGYGAK